MLNLTQENLISSRALGTLLGLTSERIRQLEDEGMFTSITKSGKKYFDLTPSVTAYIDHLRAKASLDVPEMLQMSIEKEQADLRYKKARAGKMELELAELEGQMHRAEDVEIVVTDILAKIRGAILALPGRLAVDTANAKTAAEASAIIKAVVDDTLNELSEYRYDPVDYKRLVNEREKWLTVKEAEVAKAEKAKTTKPKTKAKTTTKTSKPDSAKSQTPKRQTTSKSSPKSSGRRKA